MLKDRKNLVERIAARTRLGRRMVQEYGAFLRTLFSVGDWFVTLTFRDLHQDSEPEHKSSEHDSVTQQLHRTLVRRQKRRRKLTKYPPDPRIESWEPNSKNKREPGPPVRDAALREIEHWLLELGFESSGHRRQEIFDRLADGLSGRERRNFAKRVCKRCLICEVLKDPITFVFEYDIRKIATNAIGWVIAEEFGRIGGRWHVHILIRGVQHVRRKKWWKRAFIRFGRNRIEPIHE
jgi:hypothetical protein